MTVWFYILAILIFGLLIAVHELGHFAAAKLCGVRVEEFAVGMGPALWKKQKGETRYSLRAIPFGGFCAMTGEDGESDDPRAFGNQKLWKKLIILVAGSFNNFLLGFLIGDRFLSINGQEIETYPEAQTLLVEDGVYDFVLERGGKKIELKDFVMKRLQYPGQEKLFFGFYFAQYVRGGFGENLAEAWDTTAYYVRLVWESLGMLVHGEAGVNDLAGPVQIVDMMAEEGAKQETASRGLATIFTFGAFIAVNLAVMNMLPIPALDGGRVFLLLVTAMIEAVTRKKINPKYEAWIHGAGLILLLALMAYVMFHDIFTLVTR